MRKANIILDIFTQALDKSYSYLVPDDFPQDIVGRAVLVSFANRQAIGYVIGVEKISHFDEQAESLHKKLKTIDSVLSPSYFNEIGAQCALYLSHHYLAPLSSCIHLLLPPGGIPKMEKINNRWIATMPKVKEVDDRWITLLPQSSDFKPAKNATKQIAILDALKKGDLRTMDLRAEFGNVDQAIKTLEKKGVLHVDSRRRIRGNDQISKEFLNQGAKHFNLTLDQKKAYQAIDHAVNKHSGQVVVLEGVTGSGKTEVYLCIIENVLKQNKSAIVLVPEISLTPQTVARFRGRFGEIVAVLHSRMSQGERFDQWDQIRQGKARVVVGTRSALFAPVQNLGIIIIDEEHETSYKQDQAPRYVTRDVAQWLVAKQNATLVLGSATPSVEALYKVKTEPNWSHVTMQHRANGKSLPKISIVDMAKEFNHGSRQMFSKELQNKMFRVLESGQKVVLLLNQRGFANFLLCRNCGYVPTCKSCSTSLTYHEKEHCLICHHCGYKTQIPPKCPICGSPYLKGFGAGTQRVEAELRQIISERYQKSLLPGTTDWLFQTEQGERSIDYQTLLQKSEIEDQKRPNLNIEIIRMDADTTKKKGSHQLLLEKFMRAKSAILLGTQMIAKGLDFDDVTLVGVINADTILDLPDFRANEKTYNLIEQVAGRCGRGAFPGEVIIQTYQAQHETIKAAASYDRNNFLLKEFSIRKDLRYPPFVHIINILFWGYDKQKVKYEADKIYKDLLDIIANKNHNLLSTQKKWEIYPPTACVLEKLKNVYRFHMLIKMPNDENVADTLEDYFRKHKKNSEVSLSVDVDPVNLM